MNFHCSPFDVELLCQKWAEPQHLPTNTSLTAQARRDYYERELVKTIANWLVKGCFGWQFESRRAMAFSPVTHLIGTHPEDVSYVDSLIRLTEQLQCEADTQFRPLLSAAGPTPEPVFLGRCLAEAGPLAFEQLSRHADDYQFSKNEFHRALCDLLGFMQAVIPPGMARALEEGWSALFERAEPFFPAQRQEILQRHLFHALYPISHVGTRNDALGRLLDRIHNAMGDDMSDRMRRDYAALRDMSFGNGTQRRGMVDPAIVPRRPAPIPSGTPARFNISRAETLQ